MELLNLLLIWSLTIGYGFLNGMLGSASIVATIISSRALGPKMALLLASISTGIGPFLLGAAVAQTTSELMTPQAITPLVIISALAGALTWSLITLWLGIPSSISQALFGGLMGAIWVGYGHAFVQTNALMKILVALFVSPILGLALAYWLVRFTYWLSASATPRINRWFNRGQLCASILMAIAFGANDGQKIMAMFVLGLIATGYSHQFIVPNWIIALSALTISLGTLVGGWRIIKTLGGRFYKIRPIHGFGAQIASGTIILSAALLGGPVSGTQVVTSSIIGAGSADRIQKVRWTVTQQILTGWILTIPLSMICAAIAYKLLEGALWIN